jgi:nitrogen-specific signal transduction histidine kinase/CheY-like chemotaxis protein
MTLSPLRGEGGETVGVSLIARDVTESLRAEREAMEARAEAERANRAKSEFLSRMSHELRTPLNAILGFGQLLQLDETDERRKENVAHILRGGSHLLDLINEVLDISRIESGTMTVSVEPVSVDEMLDEARTLVAPLAAERSIDMDTQLPEGPPVWVAADRQRLKQVLLNLLSNAVKYNRPNGSITLAVKPDGDGRVRILVSDSGFGIPEKLTDRLFTPFDRLGAEQSKVEGTGLGLALTKSLVEAMGGTIEVESEEGQGSTFIVELALAQSPLEGVRDQGPVMSIAPASLNGSGGATVLYVEDNVSNLKLVEQILQRRPSITLIPAMQGKLGLELARRHKPHLILLDLHLPDMPGSHVLARLKSDPETRRIPVAMLSADATTGQIERLLAVGADEYLTKPLDVPLFLALLDRVLDHKEVTTA